MKKQIFLVLNPAAGRRSAELVHELMNHHDEQWEVTTYLTTGVENEDIGALVREALNEKAYDWVFAAGGDGTVSAVADGLIDCDIPLGIIPIGTSNSLAQELKIPLKPEEAVELLAGETAVRRLDVMQVGSHYIVLHLTVGLSTKMIAETSREAKNRYGQIAYIYNLVRQFFGHQPFTFFLEVDGVRKRVKASEIMVANAGASGLTHISWGKHIIPDDGRIDVCIVRLHHIGDYTRSLWYFLRNEPDKITNLRYLQVRERLSIRPGNKATLIVGDGEILGYTPLEMIVRPAAVSFLVAADSQDQVTS